MGSSFWAVDGDDIRDEISADRPLETGGGSFPVFPHETKVLALVSDAGVEVADGSEYAFAKFEVIKPTEWAGRKLSSRFWVFPGSDEPSWPSAKAKDKKRGAVRRFGRLDLACGGKINASDEIPDDWMIKKNFVGKQVVVNIGLIEPKPGETDRDGSPKKANNWLMDYSAKGGMELSSPKPQPKTGGGGSGGSGSRNRGRDDDLDDSDVPF